MGLTPKKSGVIQFWGEESDNPGVSHRVGWVISQKEKYSPFIKIKDYFKTLSIAYPNWNEKTANILLDKFRIDQNKKLYFLSLGEHSKVRLIKALSIHPELLVLDELTANLSPNSKKILTETLIKMFSDHKMAILYISHSDDESIRLSDRIYELTENGLKAKDGKSV